VALESALCAPICIPGTARVKNEQIIQVFIRAP
jgi:hypothetical protein